MASGAGFCYHPGMVEVLTHPPRIHEQLESYWQSLLAGRAFPLESEIDPAALGGIWDFCFLVSARADGKFAYSYLGKALVEAYGDDISGREITEKLLFPHPKSLFESFRRVAQGGKPLTDESAFVNSRGQSIKYRSCLLPLGGAKGEAAAYILGGMKWKAY